MRVGRKIDIDLTIMQDTDYDRYADAFYIVSKNEEFELLLSPKYYHYHLAKRCN